MIWTPHVTVAAVAERAGRFLMVEEAADGAHVLNQPAGHLEAGESLVEAVKRETLEETAWQFCPSALVGIYLWTHARSRTSYLRVTFCGDCTAHHADRPLDEGVLRTLWLTYGELHAERQRLRSPMVLRCIEDYLAGCRYPIELLNEIP
jgi:8-oxo-dGTP pyrophosphatase MutT (NUDIX family)